MRFIGDYEAEKAVIVAEILYSDVHESLECPKLIGNKNFLDGKYIEPLIYVVKSLKASVF